MMAGFRMMEEFWTMTAKLRNKLFFFQRAAAKESMKTLIRQYGDDLRVVQKDNLGKINIFTLSRENLESVSFSIDDLSVRVQYSHFEPLAHVNQSWGMVITDLKEQETQKIFKFFSSAPQKRSPEGSLSFIAEITAQRGE